MATEGVVSLCLFLNSVCERAGLRTCSFRVWTCSRVMEQEGEEE